MEQAIQTRADDFQALLLSLQDKLGVVVGDDKYLEITDKLDPVMTVHGVETLGMLAERLLNDDEVELRASVLQEITSPDSHWFSPSEVPALLTDYVLPSLDKQSGGDFKVWVAGCGSGQLTYSLAMIIDNFKQQRKLNCDISIVASDLSDNIVRRASKGRYSSSMLDGLPSFYCDKYLHENAGQHEVSEKIRSMIQFKTCNLVDGFEMMGHFDLIVSSDVLMYFSNSVKGGLLDGFANCLDRSGLLIVGASEPVMPYCDRFERVNHEAGTFYRQLPES